MKIVTLVLLLLVNECLYSQQIDTSYSFSPKLKGTENQFNSLDTIKLRKGILVLKCNENDLTSIKVSKYNKKFDLLEQGEYILDTVNITEAIVYDRTSGARYKRPNRVEFKYIRQGYWSYYKNGQERRIYYDEGEEVRMRIK